MSCSGPNGPPIAFPRSPKAPLCYVMSLYFLTTDQWVPSVRSNDTREWNENNAAATYRIASPPLVSEDPLHAPLRPASIGRPERGKAPPFLPEDWSASAASTEPFIHAISQPCPLQGVVRVRARAWRVRGGAWGVGRLRRPCGIGSCAPSWPSRVLGVSLMLSAACCPCFCCF